MIRGGIVRGWVGGELNQNGGEGRLVLHRQGDAVELGRGDVQPGAELGVRLKKPIQP
jgi:hypothetical protein